MQSDRFCIKISLPAEGAKADTAESSLLRVRKIMNSQQHQETKAAKRGEREKESEISIRAPGNKSLL
jgi:hypothetical protein